MSENSMDLQVKRYSLLILVALAVLAGRLWFLQVVQGQEYAEKADGYRMREVRINAPRGLIYDREGRVLAGNRLSYTLSADKGSLDTNNSEFIALLAELLDKSEAEIRSLIENAPVTYAYQPVRLLRDIGPEAVIALEEHREHLPGIVLEEDWRREYPYGTVAGNVLGYLRVASPEDVRAGYRASDLVGDAGLEREYESYLRGTDGRRVLEVNATSRPIRTLEVKRPTLGNDLHLTLDIELQAQVEAILEDHFARVREMGEYTDAWNGAAVVLDARTGAVLALASVPGYDPNRLIPPERGTYYFELLEDPRGPFINRAVRPFAPGSTFKVVTGLAALDLGAIGPEETYFATGYHKYGRRDWSVNGPCQCPAGEVDMVLAMARSANDFFWEIAFRPEMGGEVEAIEQIAAYARLLGFGAPTGIDFPEWSGTVPDAAWKREVKGEPWYPGDTMNVAIGQGDLEVTPLQLAVAYAAIANRGMLVQPYLVQRIVSPDGEILYEHEPVTRDLGIDSLYWDTIREGLRAVIQHPRGTAYQSSRFPGDVPWGASATYDPAGKTGSAQRSPGQDAHAWFAGFAPADDPEIVVVVFGEAGGGGATTAAPVARRIMDFYFEGVTDI